MDAKTGYSNIVNGSKKAAVADVVLNNSISAGHNRKEVHGENWSATNINNVVDKFTPNATPIIKNNKVIYNSTDDRYEVVADIGGGYLRIYDNKKKCYVDLDGEDVRNYTDKRGKKHGRKKTEQQALTHFRIFKREEM